MNEPEDTVDAEVVEEGALPVPVSGSPVAPVTPEFTPDVPTIGTDYTDDGVPNFDYVRDRIEKRVATSIGSAELAGGTEQAASLDEQLAKREQAGKDRLEAIRRAMRNE